jgi:Family of unknown function (DUF6134)
MLAPLWVVSAAVHATDTRPQSTWTFRALLDGRPIGEHRFSMAAGQDASERTLVSEAAFTVRVLGVTVYRYRHRAVERWRGDCLAALSSDTDDDGRRSSVSAEQQGETFRVVMPAAQTARGCVMSFAYWSPALRGQHRLINAQTGRIEAVTIAPVEEGVMGLRDRAVPAQGWRISGPARPIVVWYSAQGDWVGLDTTVDGGRQLSYRRHEGAP